MPIVIDEVEITIVTQDASPNRGGAVPESVSSPVLSEELVKQCVEKVLEVLRQKEER